MDTGNSILWTLGAALPFTGFLKTDRTLNINLLGSHSWGDYMDKLRSFQWPLFAGFVLVLIFIALKKDESDHNDHHDNNSGGHKRLQPVRVRSQYNNRL